jgi:hypothetical protein
LDDNRGFYKVTEVQASQLLVSEETEFSGSSSSPVVFGETSTGQEYAVLPTVSAGVGGNPEGQMDLRVTAAAGASDPDPNSYKGNLYSVEPFGYRVIRPTTILTEETIELVLFIRERMLSWMEEIETAAQGNKSGNYFVFQRDEHISDLGSPTVPDEGLGVPSNAFIDGLAGLTAISPFASVSDCLSVLDRRYWILDFRLDTEVPPNTGSTTPYSSFAPDAPGVSVGLTAGSGRPVEPDRIEDVLNRTDRLRRLRYSWIRFRADRVTGTLQAIERFDAELPARIAEREDVLRLQEGLDET